jgi:hypothetical protein
MLHHTTEPPDLRREALLGTLCVGYIPAREALNGTQWHSEALSGALRGTHMSISGTQLHSVVLFMVGHVLRVLRAEISERAPEHLLNLLLALVAQGDVAFQLLVRAQQRHN